MRNAELDIMRGFVPPNTERQFMRVDSRTLRTTDPQEHILFENASSYMALQGEPALVNDVRGELHLQASEQAIDEVQKRLTDTGFTLKESDPHLIHVLKKIEQG